MPSARVFGPWPEHSNPAASCLQWSCALQAEAVDTFFFFACAHLTRGRCCTSNLIAPYPIHAFSFRWLEAFFSDVVWRIAIRNSLVVGLSATSIALVLGTLAAIGLNQRSLPFKAL